MHEVLGAGTLFGVSLFGAGFQPWVVMVLPPGAFFVLGCSASPGGVEAKAVAKNI